MHSELVLVMNRTADCIPVRKKLEGNIKDSTEKTPKEPVIIIANSQLRKALERIELSRDERWEELRRFANDFKNKNNLTSAQLFNLLGLKPTPTYISFLSYDTIPNNPGTFGRALREAIEAFMENPPTVLPEQHYTLKEFYCDHCEEFYAISPNICRVEPSDNDKFCVGYTKPLTDAEKEKVANLLCDFPNVSLSFDKTILLYSLPNITPSNCGTVSYVI